MYSRLLSPSPNSTQSNTERLRLTFCKSLSLGEWGFPRIFTPTNRRKSSLRRQSATGISPHFLKRQLDWRVWPAKRICRYLQNVKKSFRVWIQALDLWMWRLRFWWIWKLVVELNFPIPKEQFNFLDCRSLILATTIIPAQTCWSYVKSTIEQ